MIGWAFFLSLYATAHAVAGAPVDDFEYVKCKFGETRCGELKNPSRADRSVRGTPICGATLEYTVSGLDTWSRGLIDARDAERGIGDDLYNLGGAYGQYPAKRDVLRALSAQLYDAVEQLIAPLLAKVQGALNCFHSDRYREGSNCMAVPVACYERSALERQAEELGSRLRGLADQIEAKRAGLLNGLPSCQLNVVAPPCRDYMDAVLNSAINRQRLLADKVYPPVG